MPKLIFKLAKAGAGAIKIQCVILSISGSCQLDMSPASGFDCPHFQIEPRDPTRSVRNLQYIFFRRAGEKKFGLGLNVPGLKQCPTLISNCLADATTCGGVRGCISRQNCSLASGDVAFWLVARACQSYNCDRGHKALGATLRSSYRHQNFQT